MTTIPQRELRNDISAILRRAEAGETFAITVNGRRVAQLGPLPEDQQRATLAEIIASTPVDDRWADEVHALREEDRAAAEDDR